MNEYRFVSVDDKLRLSLTLDDAIDASEALSALAQAQQWLDRFTARAVADAVEAGASWRHVGRCLDVSPQTAINRYRDRAPDGEIQPSLFE